MGINFCIQLNRIFYYFLRQTDNFISRRDNNSGDYTVVCSSYLRIVLIRRSNGSQIIVWILLYNNKTQRFHSPIYEYLDADRPPSGPCARRKPNSSNFTFLPATIRYLAAFVDIRLFTINNTKKRQKKMSTNHVFDLSVNVHSNSCRFFSSKNPVVDNQQPTQRQRNLFYINIKTPTRIVINIGQYELA